VNGESTGDLEIVKKRFVESEEALRRVRDELNAVLAQRRRADAITAALEESGRSIESFASAISSVVEQIVDLTARVGVAVERLDAILSGTDIQRLRTDIANQVEKLEAELKREVARLEGQVVERSQSTADQIERLCGALPKRWRKRLERQ
jgi:hypothetical protein